MATVWSGILPDIDDRALRGITDALDYFALLYSHLKECRWYDLGPSRPDLKDGIFRYKAKWGAEVTLGRVSPSTIFWSPGGSPDIPKAILEQHVFLTRQDKQLLATIFLNENQNNPESIAAMITKYDTPGIHKFRLANIQPGPTGLDLNIIQEFRTDT